MRGARDAQPTEYVVVVRVGYGCAHGVDAVRRLLSVKRVPAFSDLFEPSE